MHPTANESAGTTPNVLRQYVVSVQKINRQMHRILNNKTEVANSLTRAAAALRSMARQNHPAPNRSI